MSQVHGRADAKLTEVTLTLAEAKGKMCDPGFSMSEQQDKMARSGDMEYVVWMLLWIGLAAIDVFVIPTDVAIDDESPFIRHEESRRFNAPGIHFPYSADELNSAQGWAGASRVIDDESVRHVWLMKWTHNIRLHPKNRGRFRWFEFEVR